MTNTKAEQEAKDKLAKRDGFARWMDQPATRMMLSMIPPGEKQEVLGTLLQATFDSGYQSGSGQMLVTFVEHMFAGKRRDQF